MRRTLTGAALIAGLVIAATAAQSSSEPPVGPPHAHATNAELITHATADGQSQTVTVIDPRQRVMAVYQVNLASGQISLKSVRTITWDLQLGDVGFNTGDPSPQDVLNGLKR